MFPNKGHTDGVVRLHLSHDGTKLVSCSMDKTFKIWDAHTYELLYTCECKEYYFI
jgi:WD40 repeat protein